MVIRVIIIDERDHDSHDQMTGSMTDSGYYHNNSMPSDDTEKSLRPEDFDESAYNKLSTSVTPKKVARDCVDQIWTEVNNSCTALGTLSEVQEEEEVKEKEESIQYIEPNNNYNNINE